MHRRMKVISLFLEGLLILLQGDFVFGGQKYGYTEIFIDHIHRGKNGLIQMEFNLSYLFLTEYGKTHQIHDFKPISDSPTPLWEVVMKVYPHFKKARDEGPNKDKVC